MQYWSDYVMQAPRSKVASLHGQSFHFCGPRSLSIGAGPRGQKILIPWTKNWGPFNYGPFLTFDVDLYWRKVTEALCATVTGDVQKGMSVMGNKCLSMSHPRTGPYSRFTSIYSCYTTTAKTLRLGILLFSVEQDRKKW